MLNLEFALEERVNFMHGVLFAEMGPLKILWVGIQTEF